MKYRKLRIAWSVAWGIVCVLLLALWVRSFGTLDFFSRVNTQKIQTTIGSHSGNVYLAHFDAETAYKGSGNSTASHGWTLTTHHADYGLTHRFLWERNQNRYQIDLPHWFVAIFAILLAALSWLPWRFSLRTLLIGMTIVAAFLGWIVYVMRG